jgi:hypothetical protein
LRGLDAQTQPVPIEVTDEQRSDAIGYVTPDDEHHGRGPGIRRARAVGLKRARAERIKQNRATKR